MSTKHATSVEDLLIGGSAGHKPPHPDLPRWIVAGMGSGVVVLALFGGEALTRAAGFHTGLAAAVAAHGQALMSSMGLLHKTALAVLALTLAGLLWALGSLILWHCYHLPRVTGSYWTVVLPKPTSGRGVPASGPDGPHLFWDRLLQTLAAGSRQRDTYLAVELWGDAGGRVRWGMWMPDRLMEQRETIRRLITAQRPQARLVAATDPLHAALDGVGDRSGACERWLATARLTLSARDYYPLVSDGLAMAGTVAALRPPGDVCASCVSLVVAPAPEGWARRVDQLVRRWRWASRHDRRHDARWQEETEAISLKGQQTHARVSLRVQVMACSREAAERECRAIVGTLSACRKRYVNCTQGWSLREQYTMRMHGSALPHGLRVRAPRMARPRVWPCFPLT